MDKPVTLFFDIETLPMLIKGVYELGRQDISYKQIYKEVQVACIGYAFDDEAPKVLHMNYSKYDLHVRDDGADKDMIATFRTLVDRADLVVGHNLKSFDVSVLRSRMMKYRIPDFKPFLVDDTYLSVKDVRFTSHKLDYLAPFLLGEKYRKRDHPQEMWFDVMEHKRGAFNNMLTYCGNDVVLTRMLYKSIKPYITSSLNLSVYYENKNICPNCGASNSLQRRGFRLTLTGKFPRFYCKACGTYPSLGRNNIKRSGEFPR